ncbi:pentatricopeptide repeat-containing protein At4g38010-like isoform X2 [Hevea brasiliensis]|nr:pentatricopeptide repeat-containing protein At4g38010-like isoform X2 [Hevea brasiliensis]XP_057996260.1 pentatricopeptide repeat-containing protein At4g38010-like isoform X2 [Hevea brasiliensis]
MKSWSCAFSNCDFVEGLLRCIYVHVYIKQPAELFSENGNSASATNMIKIRPYHLKSVLLDCIPTCNNLKSFKTIHAQLVTSGIVRNDLVVNRVVDFFGKSGDFVHYACGFLKQCDWRISSFPFNSLISSYAGSDRPQVAILGYRQIVRNGFSPDVYTFPAVLKSCSKFMGIGEGRQIHGIVVKMGLVIDIYVQNSLIHLYGICGHCGGAGRVFDEMLVRDVVSWTSIISGYVRAGLFDEAVTMFLRMDVEPNIATFVSVLVACGKNRNLSIGRGIHGLIFKRPLEEGLEASNALIDMYVKCECLNEAKQIFDELPQKDIISWTSIISGLVQCNRPKDSLELFYDMQNSGVQPDRITLTSVLSACAAIGALDYGKWVHEYIDRKAIKWDIQIGTAMVDMYAKCGCIDLAVQTFNGMASKNIFTWNALLNGLAMHGRGCEAQELFEEMVRVGMMPNEVTFLAILTACCHSGLVDEGRKYFHQMISWQYNLSPRLEHYGCMIDLLCRAGLLDEALLLVKTMPMSPDVLIMGAILSACKAKGISHLSQHVLDHLIELESQYSGVYVLLSNIYASNQRWTDVTKVRRLMNEKGIKKFPGMSIIELDGKAHEFPVGDISHPRNKDAWILLKFLTNQIFREGYVQAHS